MFLMQAQVNKEIRLEKIQLQGTRLFGFVSPSDDGGSTIWGSARSTATITELPPSPIKNPPQQPCSSKMYKCIQPKPEIQGRQEHQQTLTNPNKIRGETSLPDIQTKITKTNAKTEQKTNSHIAKIKKSSKLESQVASIFSTIEKRDSQIPRFSYIIIRLPGRSSLNKPVTIKLDYSKYQSIAEADLAKEDKIIRILHEGKMYKKCFYRCDYTQGTIEYMN